MTHERASATLALDTPPAGSPPEEPDASPAGVPDRTRRLQQLLAQSQAMVTGLQALLREASDDTGRARVRVASVPWKRWGLDELDQQRSR